MLKNQSGFSLIQVVMGAGLMGVLSIVFMQFSKNMNQSQSMVQSKGQEIELKSSVGLLLSNANHCRVSLAGDGLPGAPTNPVTFQKVNIDEEGEGLDISLYYANQDGDVRLTKRYNGANNVGVDGDMSEFGKIKINSIKLIMNNGTGSNYANSASHSDIGQIVFDLDKQITAETAQNINFRIDVNVEMRSNGGTTTILGCSSVNAAIAGGNNNVPPSGIIDFGYPSNCVLNFRYRDRRTTSGSPTYGRTLQMNKGGFVGINLIGNVNGDDRITLSGSCTAGVVNPVSEYLKNCTIGLGQRDSSHPSQLSPAAINNADSYKDEQNFLSNTVLNLIGDVNGDDTFYYRMRCPAGSDPELDSYMRNRCVFCMSHSNSHTGGVHITSCKHLQSNGDNSWGRLRMRWNGGNDVDHDDELYFGFFCSGEYAPIVRDYLYIDG